MLIANIIKIFAGSWKTTRSKSALGTVIKISRRHKISNLLGWVRNLEFTDINGHKQFFAMELKPRRHDHCFFSWGHERHTDEQMHWGHYQRVPQLNNQRRYRDWSKYNSNSKTRADHRVLRWYRCFRFSCFDSRLHENEKATCHSQTRATLTS